MSLGKVSSLCVILSKFPLCSGSDDKTVIVWDGLKGKALHRLETPHEGNIFSVVWLAAGEERGLLASGAGDCRICLLDINSSKVTV